MIEDQHISHIGPSNGLLKLRQINSNPNQQRFIRYVCFTVSHVVWIFQVDRPRILCWTIARRASKFVSLVRKRASNKLDLVFEVAITNVKFVVLLWQIIYGWYKRYIRDIEMIQNTRSKLV